ncbi:acetaldehyde dehydrogenase (acetylating) [Planktosalinus lacus]|uniref:Acetaldehyde dehydrogenase n=1 Tax=Planktosalinus lacus TaxID=1526573 RepID=A0A8J2VA19_9FLAO|nr:acetaldehyde dehydrogenase (acetylating) [Planktosalinus lacus]GGD94949.1 acetaldehyde dehydrogenase [Planktosalinus lacus]
MQKIKAAIIGSGNIGTDLLIKIIRTSKLLEVSVLVGIDPKSDGLKRAEQMGIKTTAKGIDGLIEMPEFQEVAVIFDATSAKAHYSNYDKIKSFPNKKMVDLTPAAIGPFLVPAVNFEGIKELDNVNMVTCGGQATIPMVAAVSRVAKVHYAEIVASIASKSAGPGTRANIDEFTETTADAIVKVGGATRGKAIIILNPAEPPLVMRDTVFTLSEITDKERIRESIQQMETEVQHYVPGYKLKQEVQFEEIPESNPVFIEGLGNVHGLKTTIMLEVVGAGHYLPEYAGNLDIMTSAALAAGEKMVAPSASLRDRD